MSSATSRKYPPELRERAVRMVAECRHEHPLGVGDDRVGRCVAGDRHGADAVVVGASGAGRFRSPGRGEFGHGGGDAQAAGRRIRNSSGPTRSSSPPR